MRWGGGQASLGEGAGREVQSPWKAVGRYLLPSPRTRNLLLVTPAKAWVHMFTDTPPRMALAAAFMTAPNQEAPDIRRAHSKLGYVRTGGPTQQ